MPHIEIDNDVFAYLQKHARPFLDTPNSTLRRLLALDESEPQTPSSSLPVSELPSLDELLAESLAIRRTKAPKADLRALVERGLLQEGQPLHLVDYQNQPVKNATATISGGDLSYKSKRFSMSNLATELLANTGFKSKAVRGPAHWVTEDGVTVRELWTRYLAERKQR